MAFLGPDGRGLPQGTLRLAGLAERRACDFGREFTALVEEVRRSVEVG